MEEKNTTLYYTEGNSDKLYQVEIKPDTEGYKVNFAYGRRGKPLRNGTKTPTPVTYEKALKIYEKLLASKEAKGYSPGEQGIKYEGTELAQRKTNNTPQLLNPIKDEEELIDLLNNDDYWAQEKKDGERVLIELRAGEIIGNNRKGLTIPLPQNIVNTLQNINQDIILDGELMGGSEPTYYVFDIRGSGTFEDRYNMLNQLKLNAPIEILPVYKTSKEKENLLSRVETANGEGIVLKQHQATYIPGRPNSGGSQRKYKFTETASCIVTKQNGTKRSIYIHLLENNVEVPVGKTTIPANYGIPKPGTIVEIEYLYAYKGGALYQPVYRGERTDINLQDCTTKQLKYKTTWCFNENQRTVFN